MSMHGDKSLPTPEIGNAGPGDPATATPPTAAPGGVGQGKPPTASPPPADGAAISWRGHLGTVADIVSLAIAVSPVVAVAALLFNIIPMNTLVAVLGTIGLMLILFTLPTLWLSVKPQYRKLFGPIVGVICLVVALVLPTIAPTFGSGRGAAASVQVVAPLDGEVVDRTLVLRGLARNIPAGQSLVVMNRYAGDSIYYPNLAPIAVDAQGHWQQSLCIGAATPEDAAFEVFVFLLSDAGRWGVRYYQSVYEFPDGNHVFVPFKELPPGTEELARLQVRKTTARSSACTR